MPSADGQDSFRPMLSQRLPAFGSKLSRILLGPRGQLADHSDNRALVGCQLFGFAISHGTLPNRCGLLCTTLLPGFARFVTACKRVSSMCSSGTPRLSLGFQSRLVIQVSAGQSCVKHLVITARRSAGSGCFSAVRGELEQGCAKCSHNMAGAEECEAS